MLVTLFASTSVFSDVEQNNLSLPFANTIELNSDTLNSNNDHFVIPSLEKALENSLGNHRANDLKNELAKELSDVENTPLQPQSENHTQSVDFARPLRSNLLTNHLNQTPEYVLVYQLLSAQLDVFANHETTLAQVPPAWFMNFSDSSSRLSGWKDSNNLYTAKATYHLS